MKWIGTSWKMNNDIRQTQQYINTLVKNKKYLKKKKFKFFIIPPYTSLTSFQKYLRDLPIILGAQNIHHQDSGPFTGEVSASMVKSCGCKIVEIGHAERYKYFNETDILVNKKIIQAINNNLIPLVCFGEEKKISNLLLRKKELIKKIKIMFKSVNLKKNKKIILAYEPVWAIGKKNAASAMYVSETVNIIREHFIKKLNFFQNQIIIIYGGSVNKINAEKLLKIKDLDGIFIGRSAINANNFINICKLAGK